MLELGGHCGSFSSQCAWLSGDSVFQLYDYKQLAEVSIYFTFVVLDLALRHVRSLILTRTC